MSESVEERFTRGGHTQDELHDLTNHISRPGITREEVMQIYTKWAPKYEEDMHSVPFMGPKFGAQEIEKLVKDKNAPILDLAAGTGRVAQDLHKFGFTNIDALDGNKEMLEEAKKLGLYKDFYVEYIGPNKLTIETNKYDAVVTVGSFVPGHLREDCYNEVIRILKPGGYFVIVMWEKHFNTDKEWTKNIEPRMLELQEQGLWKRITRKQVKDYIYNNPIDAVVFVLQKN